MNKNIKKIIRFYWYIIALSASITECCQKNNFDLILNKQEELSLPKDIELNALFSYLNSPVINPQLNQQINAGPEKENFNNIQSAISVFTITNKRKKTDTDQNLAKKIQKTEPAEINKLSNDAKYIKLDFSSIDTLEKYEKKSLELPKGKETLVAVRCDNCPLKITGLFRDVQSDMFSHTTTQHFDGWYTKLENDSSDTNKTIKHNELYFSSIDTNKKYKKISAMLPQKKKTYVIIKCDRCPAKRTGTFIVARSNMIIHNKKHE